MRRAAILSAIMATLLLAYASGQPRRPSAGVSVQKAYFTLESATWERTTTRGDGISLLGLRIYYYGTNTLLDVTSSLRLECGASILTTQPILLGSWEPGTPKEVVYAINVSRMTPRCPATINIQHEGIAVRTSTGYDVIPSVGGGSITFTLEYAGTPDIRVRVQPSTIYSGAVNSILLVLENVGTGDAIDLSAAIAFSGASVLEVEHPVKMKVSRLEAGSSIDLKLRVVPTSSQVGITVTYDFVDDLGNHRSGQFGLGVPVVSSFAIVVVAEPSKLVAGSSSSIALRIHNYGSSTLRNSLLVLGVPQGSRIVVTPQVLEVGDVEPGGSKEVGVDVSVPNTASGAQSLTYSLIYESEEGTKVTYKDYLTMFIVERAQLAITSVEVVPQRPVSGGTVITSLTLINLGSQAVGKVNVTAIPLSSLAPIRRSYYFLGQVQPQSPTSIPFSFRILEPGTHAVMFNITFEDVYGIKWSLSRSVSFEAVEQTLERGEGGGAAGYQMPLAALVIIAVAAGMLLFVRARSRGRRE